MPTLTIPNTFVDSTTIVAADMNANFNAVAALANSTKFASDNIQTGGVATSNIADGAITTVKLADASVTTAKIIDANVTLSKMATASVGTTALVDASVTTAKLVDANVTTAKIAAVNAVQSAASTGAYNNNTSSYTTACTTTLLNPTGKPVLLTLQPDGTGGGGNYAEIALTVNASTSGLAAIAIFAGGSEIFSTKFERSYASSSTEKTGIPPNLSFVHLNPTPGASIVYTVQAKNIGSAAIEIKYCVLAACELK
jgi:hypothetical protein